MFDSVYGPAIDPSRDRMIPINPIEDQMRKRHTKSLYFKPGQEEKIKSFWS